MKRRHLATLFLLSVVPVSACNDASTSGGTDETTTEGETGGTSSGSNETTGGHASTTSSMDGTQSSTSGDDGGTTSSGDASTGTETDTGTTGTSTGASDSTTSPTTASTGSEGGTTSDTTGTTTGATAGTTGGTGTDTGASGTSGTATDTGAGSSTGACASTSMKRTTTEAYSLDDISCSPEPCPPLGALPWIPPDNITADDGVYSVATRGGPGGPDRTEVLLGVKFGFAIPSTATIEGVEVTVKRRTSSAAGVDDVVDAFAHIWWGGAIWGGDRAKPDSWTTTDTVVTYGGPTDLWGVGSVFLNPAKVNDVSFGFALAADITQSTTAEVDYIAIEVFYCD